MNFGTLHDEDLIITNDLDEDETVGPVGDEEEEDDEDEDDEVASPDVDETLS